jgi:D-3-phosphoglycerate dehydrogenase / 2-oxoglutarate reductase
MSFNLKSCRVLVTPTSFGKTNPQIRQELESAVGKVIYNDRGRPLTSQEVGALVVDCDGYIAGLDTIDETSLGGASRLKVIARYGVGVDHVDIGAATRRSIVVTNTPKANTTSVAELTIGLLLCLSRSIPQIAEQTRRGEWPRVMGLALEGKTVGLLGFGAIGKQVARRLHAFDCKVLAHDSKPDASSAVRLHTELVSLPELTRRSDFLSLHLPLLPETRNLVDASFLSRMKRGSFLINTARGELVDEMALASALQSQRLRGAAIDVFGAEPPLTNHPLLSLSSVIATPHCASHTDVATEAMGWASLHDCLAVLCGKEPKYPVKIKEGSGASQST